MAVRSFVDGILAIPAALLPSRYWQSFDLPVVTMVSVSSFVTLAAGFLIGIPGYFAYIGLLFDSPGASILDIAGQQVAGTLPETGEVSGIPSMLGLTAPIAFAFFTPLGLTATYLIASGLFRIIAWYVDDARGDPILSAADGIGRRAFTSHRQRSDRAARATLERADEPDRRYDGEWAGLPGVDFVIVSARRKPGWTKGSFVITSDGWFTLGEPFDRPMPNGLRTVYPLTLQTTADVLRKGLSYELPPLRPTTPRRTSADSTDSTD